MGPASVDPQVACQISSNQWYMDAMDLNHSRSYVVTMPDPMSAWFEVMLLPCFDRTCVGDGEEGGVPFCCRALFVPLTQDGIERLKRDSSNQAGHEPSRWTDVERRLLGEVIGEIVVHEDGKEVSISILRLLPMIVRPCVADALFEIYVRTVPSVVDSMEAAGVMMPGARSIVDRGYAGTVGDHHPDQEAP